MKVGSFCGQRKWAERRYGNAVSACDGVILQRCAGDVEGLTKVIEVFLGICIFNVPNKSPPHPPPPPVQYPPPPCDSRLLLA